MSDLKTFTTLITTQVVLLLLVISYAAYMAELNCPQLTALQDQFDSVPYNETSPVTALQNTWALLSLIFTGCTGIPWWIYIVIWIPSLIGIVVYVTPFIGS